MDTKPRTTKYHGELKISHSPGPLKGTVFPEGFILVVDTRERTPLFNTLPKGLTIVRDTLRHGDYSIRGFEDSICIERKGMGDLMSYIGAERANTKRKLELMRPIEWKGLAIEENWDDLFMPKLYSQVHPEAVRQSLVSFSVKFGLHIFSHPHREELARWILDRLVYFYKLKRRV